MSTEDWRTGRTPGERRVFRLIRMRPGISRVELAGAAHLTTGTVTQIVKRLLRDGWVQEGEVRENPGLGRSRIGLVSARERERIVGLLVRSDVLRWVAVDWRGTVKRSGVSAWPEGPRDRALGEIWSRIRGAIEAESSAAVVGAGISYPSFPHAVRADALAFAESEIFSGLPLVTINNGAAAALGEAWGFEPPPDRRLTVYFGAGIGGALVEGRGASRPPAVHPAEAGHVGISRTGAPCICGNRGCVELVAAPRVLERRPGESLDDLARRRQDASDSLLYALTSVLNVLDVTDVTLTGMAAATLEDLYGSLVERLGALATPRGAPVHARVGGLGEDAPAQGAAVAAMDAWGAGR